jgi:hypothetical protein
MKRSAFLKILAGKSVCFFRNGANHDIFVHRPTGKKIAIPRHNEFSNKFVNDVLKEIPPK